jgi:excinuclease UvrABC nuclease subunit
MSDKGDNYEVYEVYEVTYKGRVVYIGAGLKGRSAHAKSGASHNVKLNELFFKHAENMKVLVLREGLSQEEALESEKEFIMASQPEFNITHNKKTKFRKYTV